MALKRPPAATAADEVFFLPGYQKETHSLSYAHGRYDEGSSAVEGQSDFSSMLETHGDLEVLLDKYLNKPDATLLEIGPLHSPSLNPAYGSERVVYWDADLNALRALARESQRGRRPAVYPKFIHLNDSSPQYWAAFSDWNREVLGGGGSFYGAVISQVLNYVDYRTLLTRVAALQETGDFLFILNTVDYGDRDFMHPRRPRNPEEVERKLATLGYVIVERKSANYLRDRPTVTLVAQKL